MDPQLVAFFFDFHWRVRNNESIRHHSLNCLIQLASLNGQCLNMKNLRQEYLTNYIRGLIQLIDNIGKSFVLFTIVFKLAVKDEYICNKK